MGLLSFFNNVFNNKLQQNHYLVIDIGGRSVKCLIVKIATELNRGFIIGSGRAEFSFDCVQSGQIIDIHQVSDQTASAFDQAISMAGIKPINALAGITGPNVISQINQVSCQRKNPKSKITASELQGIFQDIQRQSKIQVQQTIRKEKNIAVEIELINAAVIDILIDNTPVKNPLDFTGQILQISIYNSFAPIMSINAVQSVIDELKLNLISIINQPYALAKSFNPDQYQFKDSIFIDIGDDTTDIAINLQGKLLGTRCFDFGGRHFTEVLADSMDIPLAKAEQYKIDYGNNLLSVETEQELRDLFYSPAQQWLKLLIKSLLSFDKNNLPHKLFLCGGGAKLPDILHVLSSNWHDQLSLSTRPAIKQIHSIDIENIVDKTSELNTISDIPSLCLASMGLKFNHYDSTGESMLKRIMQTIRT